MCGGFCGRISNLPELRAAGSSKNTDKPEGTSFFGAHRLLLCPFFLTNHEIIY
jgi:hypothetical protein